MFVRVVPRLRSRTSLTLWRPKVSSLTTLTRAAGHRAILPATTVSSKKLERGSFAKSLSTQTADAASEGTTAGLVGKRFKLTSEVIASKVFWAGFGWQGTSIIADGMGMGAESASFAVTTGVGEALAVFMGHSVFYCVIKGSDNKSAELGTALWLGTATACSGTAWQPIVNLLCSVTDSFPLIGGGTMVVCGSAFYAGLRLARAFWGETLGLPIAKRDYENLCSDAGLSIAIGGATGMFVACDPALAMNVFAPAFGVLETDSNIIGMLRAGAATGTGYGLVQAVQNFFPKGRNWMDMYLK